jgi:hypothetical protein
LQSDELATVRLFQENTPSVVYITNLAVKYVSFSSFDESKIDFFYDPFGFYEGFDSFDRKRLDF